MGRRQVSDDWDLWEDGSEIRCVPELQHRKDNSTVKIARDGTLEIDLGKWTRGTIGAKAEEAIPWEAFRDLVFAYTKFCRLEGIDPLPFKVLKGATVGKPPG